MQNSNVSNNTILGGAPVGRGKKKGDCYNTIVRALAWGGGRGGEIAVYRLAASTRQQHGSRRHGCPKTGTA